MAPSTPGAATKGTHEAASDLAPLTPAGYPAPSELSAQLKLRIDTLLGAIRRDRTVARPEDTHAAVRQLADWYTKAEDYKLAYSSVQTHIERAAEEELLEAESVGRKPNTTHTPRWPMTVPADGMTITLAPQYATTRDIDMDQILSALALVVADEWADGDGDGRVFDVGIAEFAVEVARRAVGLYRKTEPSVKAVQALAATAGSRGDDQTAATVNSAVRETSRTYLDRVRVSVKPAV